VGGYDFGVFNGPADLVDGTCAAVLVEPIQSMGGVRVMTAAFARALRRRCDETGALLIFDEVQTAPARTGTWFAGEHWDVKPDLITTAKGIAAGFPAAVVLAKGAVAATVAPGDQGTTFGGGPVACAAIDATLEALEAMDAPLRARAIEARVREGLPGVEVLGLGALLGVRVPGPDVTRRLREEHRVLVGGCPGDPTIVRLFPPVTITDAEIDEGLDAIRRVLG
jgi:acetylornithine/succinyldiaminopimelate/putrescine aminotransferase